MASRVKTNMILLISLMIVPVIMSCENNNDPEPGNQTNPTVTETSFFERHTIDDNFAGIHCIKLIDLDGDGDKDIVGGSEITPVSNSKGIAWWRNDGGQPVSWTRFTVDASFEHVMSVDSYDIDGDSLPDIAATSWSLHEIAWWKNPGEKKSAWIKSVIRNDFTNAHDAGCRDLDGDGDTDIAAVSSGGEVIICYSKDSTDWNIKTLSSSFYGGKTIRILDIDGDDDVDLAGIAADANCINWWENKGDRSWSPHAIESDFPGGSGLDLTDLNGDTLYDVIGTSYKENELAYWICHDLNSNQWGKTTVTHQLMIAVNPRGCDIDLDGDIDIVASGKDPGELNIYFNDRFDWTKMNLRSNFTGATALDICDLDGDGDADIIAGASVLGFLYWWENNLASE